MLVQTSLANRTSPVLRGKWVMEVLLGTPPPPPPPNVPTLDETAERQGRQDADDARADGDAPQNPTCNACHRFMDPIGLCARQLRRDRALAGRARTACRSTRAAISTTARRYRRPASCRRRC